MTKPEPLDPMGCRCMDLIDYPEVAAYRADPANEAYLLGVEFDRRLVAMLERLHAGERMTAGDMAREVRLPFPVFRELLARYLAFVHTAEQLAAEAEQETKH